jgi:hypothetical protein
MTLQSILRFIVAGLTSKSILGKPVCSMCFRITLSLLTQPVFEVTSCCGNSFRADVGHIVVTILGGKARARNMIGHKDTMVRSGALLVSCIDK